MMMFIKSSGHTLIELMVTVFIISILAFAAIPIFSSYTEDSRIDELKANLLKAAAAQEKYFAARGQYAPSSASLSSYGFPADTDDMKLFTGLIFRQNVGMSFWVAGNRDVNPDVTDTYNECWVYFGTVLGPGGSDNFMRLHEETGNNSTNISGCSICPALDDVCK